MKPIKYKFLRRYKKVENFLKSHPFWPSFLSNGGLLTLLLVASVVFTVICGRNSVKDITPELKVIDLEFDGKYKTYLGDISIIHDIDKDTKEFIDMFYVSYGSTDEPDSASKFDDISIRKRVATECGVSLDKETSVISKIRFHVYNDIKRLDTKYNLHLDEKASFEKCVALPDTLGPQLYTQYIVSCKDSLNRACFKDRFTGNFVSSSRRNPYIYFNFLLDGNFILHPDKSSLDFVFAEKDKLFSQTLNPVNILQVFPEPTYQSPSSIIYKGEDLAKVIKNNGFTFLGEDLSIKQSSDRSIFLWTVLFGTSIAITIDILVNLIIKWRDILPKKRKHN